MEAAPEIYAGELAERISGRWLPLKSVDLAAAVTPQSDGLQRSATILAYPSCFCTYPGLPP
jgi:hypothetical protein